MSPILFTTGFLGLHPSLLLGSLSSIPLYFWVPWPPSLSTPGFLGPHPSSLLGSLSLIPLHSWVPFPPSLSSPGPLLTHVSQLLGPFPPIPRHCWFPFHPFLFTSGFLVPHPSSLLDSLSPFLSTPGFLVTHPSPLLCSLSLIPLHSWVPPSLPIPTHYWVPPSPSVPLHSWVTLLPSLFTYEDLFSQRIICVYGNLSLFYRSQLYEDGVETWILIGDTSCKHPSIHCKRYISNPATSFKKGRVIDWVVRQLSCARLCRLYFCCKKCLLFRSQLIKCKSEIHCTMRICGVGGIGGCLNEIMHCKHWPKVRQI